MWPEGIFGQVVVAQHAPADAQHHRPMPANQRGERRLIAVYQKTLKKPTIAGVRGRAAQEG